MNWVQCKCIGIIWQIVKLISLVEALDFLQLDCIRSDFHEFNCNHLERQVNLSELIKKSEKRADQDVSQEEFCECNFIDPIILFWPYATFYICKNRELNAAETPFEVLEK